MNDSRHAAYYITFAALCKLWLWIFLWKEEESSDGNLFKGNLSSLNFFSFFSAEAVGVLFVTEPMPCLQHLWYKKKVEFIKNNRGFLLEVVGCWKVLLLIHYCIIVLINLKYTVYASVQ